jgi:hypothetical protein
MGFNQSSAKSFIQSPACSSIRSGDLFSAVLAGFGIWTKPSQMPSPTSSPEPQQANCNVYPLRVIRVKEAISASTASSSASNAPKMAGRMVISGRMSDVCAELDRLAA